MACTIIFNDVIATKLSHWRLFCCVLSYTTATGILEKGKR